MSTRSESLPRRRPDATLNDDADEFLQPLSAAFACCGQLLMLLLECGCVRLPASRTNALLV